MGVCGTHLFPKPQHISIYTTYTYPLHTNYSLHIYIHIIHNFVQVLNNSTPGPSNILWLPSLMSFYKVSDTKNSCHGFLEIGSLRLYFCYPIFHNMYPFSMYIVFFKTLSISQIILVKWYIILLYFIHDSKLELV